MIKFFRKVRQQLLSENKFSKYLLYAIGEIILVILGILIALQINNWNENRKDTAKEIQFLNNFKNDLITNKKELNRIIKKTEKLAAASDSILKLYHGELEDFGMEKFIKLVMRGGSFVTYKTREGTIQDLLSSGALNNIKNDNIRLAIGSWKDNLKEIREWEEYSINSKQVYDEYLSHHIDIYNFNSEQPPINNKIKKNLFNDRLFLNNVSDRVFYNRRLNHYYKNEFPKLDTLIAQINKELEIKI
ncbi:DUF6090 family protein [Hyunsoonleella aestuarii]|uniref:Uncharacterized protein n=1 Tax=Hyunsoonleella aestuarii TaxID=912802 RepID=A0ABP8E7P9_9FLAO|nr:DUF6090 family protein [Hyunsoonleella aestuarii]